MELLSRLECAPDYDGNSEARIIAWIGKAEYGLGEMPALIGLYGGEYLVAFQPSE